MRDINRLIYDGRLSKEELDGIMKNLGGGIIAVPQNERVEVIPFKIYDTVIKFMKDNDITCEESIHQMDSVIENAYDFISDLFNIVKEDLDIEVDDE